ncbi:hypothetical protein KIN20_009826 [Parelaphostrongylus tenuis]|uniref:Serine-threonine/tyrosine-protein kinase catalytic domain-containing protein n=1 Tax=Parelaphostrongylus tenuis TaxID=148309 RepID=A0AAD5QJX2_PARTN|nr:hypothetical protein KIN20_009826 [Parelaphostrongylus tenuis]
MDLFGPHLIALCSELNLLTQKCFDAVDLQQNTTVSSIAYWPKDGGTLNVNFKTRGYAVTVSERLSMCKGTAQGVEYFYKHSCIHMELAFTKVTNQFVNTGDDQHVHVPLKTNVYSYGVMVYEILTTGKEPRNGFSKAEVKKRLIVSWPTPERLYKDSPGEN